MNYSKKEVDFQTLIFAMVHKWKTICVCVALLVIVFGGRAVYQVLNVDEVKQIDVTNENEEKIASLENEILELEYNINRQKEYNEKSILMQIDPEHKKISSVCYSIYTENSEMLYLIYYMYVQYAPTISSELIDAGKVDIDKIYLDEIVKVTVNYDGSANARYGTILFSITHNDMNECENITALYADALEKYANIVKEEVGDFKLTKIFEQYRDIQDRSLEKTQKQNIAAVSYDNLDAVNKQIKEYKESIASLRPVVHEQNYVSSVLRGILKGIIAGLLVGIIIISVMTIFSNKIFYASDLQGMFGIDEIVCLESSKKGKGMLFELEKRLSGKYPNILEEDIVEKYLLYKISKVASQNEKVAVLGDKSFDTQVTEKIKQCCSAIKDDLIRVIDNISEFKYIDSSDNYGGAFILVREGFTTYKQVYDIIKVLEGKEIRIISVIATIGEKK